VTEQSKNTISAAPEEGGGNSDGRHRQVASRGIRVKKGVGTRRQVVRYFIRVSRGADRRESLDIGSSMVTRKGHVREDKILAVPRHLVGCRLLQVTTRKGRLQSEWSDVGW